MKISIIDIRIGNLRSVQKAFAAVGAEVELVSDPVGILAADKLVLPGVGAFGAGMTALQSRGLVAPIQEAVSRGIPLLGICLGMQLLFATSEEMGTHQGLNLLPGRVVRFPEMGLVVPHMGWNELEPVGAHPLLDQVPAGAHAYFVHSFYCAPDDPAIVTAWTEYGQPVPAIVARDQVFGIQFHPEKSQHVGLQIMQNYVNLT